MKSLISRPVWMLFSGGFVAGTCLGLAVLLLLIGAANLNRAAPDSPIALGSATTSTTTPSQQPAPSATQTVTPRPTSSPTSVFQSRFVAGEDMLYSKGDPEGALVLLVPLSKEVTSVEDLARAYEDLGNAEYMMARFQRAAAYFEALLDYRPGPDSLYLVAEAYDMGGDLDHALEAYLRLAAWPNEQADTYREEARIRADEIIQIIGTPVP